MRRLVLSAVVLAGLAGLSLAAGVHREAPLVGHRKLTPEVSQLEEQVARSPADEAKLIKLGQAYVARGAPGLAVAAIRNAPPELQQSPHVQHLWARALLHQGLASQALAMQRQVLQACDQGRCDLNLQARAQHHECFLQGLVQRGIEDYRRDPDGALDAYRDVEKTMVAIVSPMPSSSQHRVTAVP